MFVEGDLDTFDFELASILSRPLSYVREEMPNNEYLQWRAYFVYRNAQAELAANVRKQGR